MTQTIPFNFEDLYKNAQQIFKQAGYDVNEGSNVSQLCAVMAYLISALNLNTAFNINETLLPYATKRKNILQDARVLGYEAQHKVSYVYNCTITPSDDLIGFGTVTIPKLSYLESNTHKYYVWEDNVILDYGSIIVNDTVLNPELISTTESVLTKADLKSISSSKTYYYFGNSKLVISGSDLKVAYTLAKEVFEKEKSFRVKEGNLIQTETDNIRTLYVKVSESETKVSQFLDIPYTDVEENGIQCFVSFFDKSGEYQNNIEFTRANDYFFEPESFTNHFLRLDDIEMCTPRVFFQYAGMGQGLPEDAQVRFNILVSSGKDGEASDIGSFKTVFPTDNGLRTDALQGAEIKLDLAITGTSEESNNSIKINAPKVYNTAHRLITCKDYQSHCNKNTIVKDSVVWGGELEFPKAPGHIWFSFYKPTVEYKDTDFKISEKKYTRKTHEWYLKNTEIQSVFESLKNKNVPSLVFHHRHPIFLIFDYTIKILKYNTRQDVDTLNSELFNVLEKSCFRCESDEGLALENFNVEYFHTNVVKRLDYSISDLSGFNIDLSTKFVLNQKTLCTENWNPEYKDIYIPLCVPFEKYFDGNGLLNTSKLPSIDTKKFVKLTYNNGDTEIPYLTGDLYTDWSYITDFQKYKKEVLKDKTKLNGLDEYTVKFLSESDLDKKMFIAPVKLKLRYFIELKETVPNQIKLGFLLAPNNDKDLTYKNIQVLCYEDGEFVTNSDSLSVNYSLLTKTFSDESIAGISDSKYPRESFTENFIYNSENRNCLTIVNPEKLEGIKYLEIRFERTCGYYYLFNSYTKNILIHLFVNDTKYSKVLEDSLKSEEGYESLIPSNVREAWETHESEINDSTMFNDITYSEPRSYLFTNDRRYLTCIEPTGTELETEPHYFAYNENGIDSISEQIRELLKQGKTFYDSEIQNLIPSLPDYARTEEGSTNGHYLTTEGYLLIDEDPDSYTGPLIRQYNEAMYLYSPLSKEMFKNDVYMNLKYSSLNFKVRNNVIPRLNSVAFKDA